MDTSREFQPKHFTIQNRFEHKKLRFIGFVWPVASGRNNHLWQVGLNKKYSIWFTNKIKFTFENIKFYKFTSKNTIGIWFVCKAECRVEYLLSKYWQWKFGELYQLLLEQLLCAHADRFYHFGQSVFQKVSWK